MIALDLGFPLTLYLLLSLLFLSLSPFPEPPRGPRKRRNGGWAQANYSFGSSLPLSCTVQVSCAAATVQKKKI